MSTVNCSVSLKEYITVQEDEEKFTFNSLKNPIGLVPGLALETLVPSCMKATVCW
jgi:hypothetical protein